MPLSKKKTNKKRPTLPQCEECGANHAIYSFSEGLPNEPSKALCTGCLQDILLDVVTSNDSSSFYSGERVNGLQEVGIL